MQSRVVVSDYDLVDARDNWSGDQWASHFHTLGVRAAGNARYDANGSNDVLKVVLLKVQKGRCWLQGSSSCQSRALLAREAQIDHVIPKAAPADVLRDAIRSSRFQMTLFDVHDPGNLAIICSPCNQEKSTWTTAHHMRRERFEDARAQVISGYQTWQRDAAVDDATVKALAGVNLTDALVREIYSDIIATMVENLAAHVGNKQSLYSFQEVMAETELFHFQVRPSDSVIEAEVESRAEMEADDRRHGI